MTALFTIAQVERFKREAKRLHRESHISHSQALDQIANVNGYSNWSLLAKHSDAHDAPKAKNVPPPFRFVRTPEQMRLALLKVPDRAAGVTPPGSIMRSSRLRTFHQPSYLRRTQLSLQSTT